jgi:hypothetical protein
VVNTGQSVSLSTFPSSSQAGAGESGQHAWTSWSDRIYVSLRFPQSHPPHHRSEVRAGILQRETQIQEKAQVCERKTPVFPRDAGSRPCVKLESVMAAEIANVNEATSAPKIAAARLTKGTMAKQEDEKSTGNSI